MTKVVYECTTKEGNKVKVSTLADARKIAAGGEYTVRYEEYTPTPADRKTAK